MSFINQECGFKYRIQKDSRLFTKEEQDLLEDILGHVNIDVEEMDVFWSMKDKIKSLYIH